MAEIKIEKKKPIWPWILAALAVLLVLFLIFNDSDDEADDMDSVSETEQTEEDEYLLGNSDSLNNNDNDEVNNFVMFVETDSEDKMGLSHNYTQTALERLVDAVETEAEEANVEVDKELERINNISDYMTAEAYATQHADSLKVAFEQINTSLEKIQTESNSGATADIDGLQDKTEEIKDGQNMLDQKDAIRAYFEKAANVLEEMNNNSMAQNQNNQ